jgi:CRISPR system Cascade subunit CasB
MHMTSPHQSRAAALIEHLQGLAKREDRGALAALRRGLGKEPGTTPEMYRLVEPYLGSARKEQADAGYLVASLLGLHPVPWEKPADPPWNTSFGWSLRVRFRDDGDENEGVTRRFTALLSCERDALPTHLRQLLALLHGKEGSAPVNWEQLFWDIVHWEDVDRKVQRRWAEAFWRGGQAPDTATAAPEPDDRPSTDEDS